MIISIWIAAALASISLLSVAFAQPVAPQRYNVVELNASVQRIGINTGGSGPPPRPMLRAAVASEMAVAAPAVEAGESIISVNASGAVEIG